MFPVLIETCEYSGILYFGWALKLRLNLLVFIITSLIQKSIFISSKDFNELGAKIDTQTLWGHKIIVGKSRF